MKSRLFAVTGLCALIVSLVLVAAPIPVVAQTRPGDTANGGSQMVAGTGVTIAELRDLGWAPEQIAEIQAAGTQNAGTQNANSPNAAETANPNTASSNTVAGNGGSNWGWLGLIGLLGLLGLGGRGRRAEVVRDERDIRRVA